MSLDWRNPGMQYLTGNSIYDFNLNNPMGLSGDPGNWNAGQVEELRRNGEGVILTGVNRGMGNEAMPQGYGSYLNSIGGFDPVTGAPLTNINNAYGNTMISFDMPSTRFGGGGGPGGGGQGRGGLQQQPMGQLQTGSRLGGLTAPAGGAPSTGFTAYGAAPGATGGLTMGTAETLPVASGLSGASLGGGSAAAAAAPAAQVSAAAATPSWWSGILKNKSLMNGILTGVASAYSQYQKKGQAKDLYRAQQHELDAQRAYEEEQYQRRTHSPAALMTPYLMEAVMRLYAGKLSKRGIQLPLDEMLQQILGGLNGGGQSQVPSGGGMQHMAIPGRA